MSIRSFREFRELGEPDVLYAEKIYLNDEWDIVKGKFVNKNKIVEDLTGTQLRNKMRELDKLLKDFDFYYHYSDDSRSYRRGKEQQDAIEKLVKDIGPTGLKRYRKYIKKMEEEKQRTNESVNKPRTLEQTVAQRYGQSTVLPETVGIKHTGSLNEIRPVGGKGKSYFNDGQLYSGFQFFPRTPKLRSMEEKCLERNSVFGKVYKG